MSNPIDSVVQVNILLNAAQATQKNFGRGLILGSSNRLGGPLFAIFQSAAAMLTAGFQTSDPEYVAAVSYFEQPISPPDVMVGYAPADVAQVATITPTAVDLATYTVTINGVISSFTAGSGTSASLIVTGLKAAIAAQSPALPVVTSGSTTLIVTSSSAGLSFTISVGANLALANTTPSVGYDTALTNITNASGGTAWYALITCSRVASDIEDAAAWIEASGNYIYIACSSDAGVLVQATTTDIASVLQAENYFRTALLWSAGQATFPDAAWVGLMLPFAPGSANWKFKTLTGSVADTLTASQVATLNSKNANYYYAIAGISMTFNGNMAQGEWIDVILGRDWLKATIQADILTALANTPKVPFTDQGISMISVILYADLQRGVNQGVLASFTVTEPKASSFSVSQKNLRVLTGLSFTGVLAGALNSIVINGNLVP